MSAARFIVQEVGARGPSGKVETVPTIGAVPEYPVEALPVAARSLVSFGVEVGLPAALLAGSALAALAAAVGPAARLQVTPAWCERAILWIPNLAPRGAGKSPAQELAFAPLRDHDAQLQAEGDEGDEGEDADVDDRVGVLFGDLTLEALARNLH